MHFWLSTQVVSHWYFTAEALVGTQVSPCEICGGWSGTETGFSHSTLVFSCQYHAITSPCSSSMCFSYQKDKWEKPVNHQTKHCSFGYQDSIEQNSNFVVGIRQLSLLWNFNCFHYRYMLKDQHLQLAIWTDLNWMLSGSLLCQDMADCIKRETGAMFSVTGASRYVAGATPWLRYEVTALRFRFVRHWQCDIKMHDSILEVGFVPIFRIQIKWHHIPGYHSFNYILICLMMLYFVKFVLTLWQEVTYKMRVRLLIFAWDTGH